MMKKYALLIAFAAMAPMLGAAHAPEELTMAIASSVPDFVPFSPKRKEDLVALLRASRDEFLRNMGCIMPARDDAYWQTVLPVLRDCAGKRGEKRLQAFFLEVEQKNEAPGV